MLDTVRKPIQHFPTEKKKVGSSHTCPGLGLPDHRISSLPPENIGYVRNSCHVQIESGTVLLKKMNLYLLLTQKAARELQQPKRKGSRGALIGGSRFAQDIQKRRPSSKKSRHMGWGAIADDVFHTISVHIEFKLFYT